LHCLRILVAIMLLAAPTAWGVVDTLKDTSEVVDCFIYSWESCNPEEFGEDCRRFNAGGIAGAPVGKTAGIQERRMLFALPGWNDTIPDSSELLVYCFFETDTVDRRIFLYPLTRQFYEGSEVDYNLGNYPDPDSGATWLHAYLDDGDADSVMWTTSGGDYTTAVACTTMVTNIGEYFSFRDFNRILTYWDTSGSAYGFILINENATPTFTSSKAIKSSESSTSTQPMVLLYSAEESDGLYRRRRCAANLNNGH